MAVIGKPPSYLYGYFFGMYVPFSFSHRELWVKAGSDRHAIELDKQNVGSSWIGQDMVGWFVTWF